MAETPSKRFDLFAAADLQSRDGGLSKGSLIHNGFAEKDQNGEQWMWQRPGLGTQVAPPIAGNGLGLYLVGTALWGLYHAGTGTATSQTVTI